MEDQKSDSSSCESSSEEDLSMETESDEDNGTSESQPSQEPFILPLLQLDNITSKQEKINSYLKNKNHFSSEKKTFLIDKTTESVPASFTPWWEGLNTEKNSDQGTSSKDSKSEHGVYDSWFDKSSATTDTSNWLCGPRSKSSIPDNVAQVEDIEVPSIYGNVSKPKGRRALKKERKELRNKTTGKKWFDMKLPDVDSKTKMDMELLQMRKALDPKRFYKQNDRTGFPKYFQLGTVVDEGTDFFSSRLTKKQRKQTLVEELMADANIRQYNKKKYEEVQQKQRSKKFTKKKKT